MIGAFWVLSASCGEQITGKQVYQFLLEFDMIYGKMTDLEKKKFMRTFVRTIELYPERDDSGRKLRNSEVRLRGQRSI